MALVAVVYICYERIEKHKNSHKNNKKDGYRQRNVRQFLHILASPGYAPGSWVELVEFNVPLDT